MPQIVYSTAGMQRQPTAEDFNRTETARCVLCLSEGLTHVVPRSPPVSVAFVCLGI